MIRGMGHSYCIELTICVIDSPRTLQSKSFASNRITEPADANKCVVIDTHDTEFVKIGALDICLSAF
jgi:hypothetical protein